MFNVAVIRLKDLIKFIFLITVVIALMIFCSRFLYKKNFKKINIRQKISNNISGYVKQAVNKELPKIDNDTGKVEENEIKQNKLLNAIIGLELGVINAKEKSVDDNTEKNNAGKEVGQITDSEKKSEKVTEKKTKENENNSSSEQEKTDDGAKKELELAKDDQKTEVTTKNPIADAYTKKYKGVKIKNETSYDLTDEDLNPEKLNIDKSNIIIFHTHTCESYTSSKKYAYTPTGNFRTTDLKYSVAKVGDELTKYLKKYNFNVIHNKTYHDYPSYNGSYSRSLATVSNILKNTKADIIIDLHRDAIGSYSGYAPTVKIGDDECAQIMFVIGTDGGKLKHPNWKSNLQFAIKVQEKANKEYPGLFKPIILRNSRYNQHLSKAACIIEVGSTGNKLEQCMNSMKYLSKIINDI